IGVPGPTLVTYSFSSARSIPLLLLLHLANRRQGRCYDRSMSMSTGPALTRDEYLRIPYVLVVESVPQADGNWCRRASQPAPPGGVAEAESAVDAMDAVDERRVRIILDWLEAGIPVPVPRPPL